MESWDFSLTYEPGVNTVSNKNEHQEYILGGGGVVQVTGA